MSEAAADYDAHDTVYRRLRAEGRDGWSEASEYGSMLGLIWPILAASLDATGRPKLLELGCGAGNLSRLLSRKGFDVAGVDISPTAVAWGNELSDEEPVPSGVKLVVGNVVDLAGFENDEFDVVVDGHCLHCIIGDDRAACLRAVKRVLRPEGRFITLTMCGPVLNSRIKQMLDADSMNVIVDGRPTRHIGAPGAIRREIECAGFEIESFQVSPRRTPDEHDDLIIGAVKPESRR